MSYTLAVTSCKRHDLLKKTLDSFIAKADILPERTVIVEDSDLPQPEWLNAPQFRALGAGKWIANGQRRGQMYTIDKLYDEVRTPYVFHLEDDWLFIKGQQFIHKSLDILHKHRHISSVSLRGTDCNGHPIHPLMGYPFSIQQPGWQNGWGGYSFNPGMRRLEDLKIFGGSFGRVTGYGRHGCGDELKLSRLALEQGFRIAVLAEEPHVRHIGGGVSKAIEMLPPLPKVLLAIPVTQQYAYGTHTSGIKRITEGRIGAVRNTWIRDAESFPNLKPMFFFGGPKPLDSWSSMVEYLDCPDDYLSLPAKVKAVCRYALDAGFDFLIKSDDDTLLYIDRLMRSGFDTVDQMGYFPYPEGRVSTHNYAVGMCYTLNRRCLELVANAPLPGASDHINWAEDYWVGRVLRDAGVRPTHNPGWVTGGAQHYVKFPLPPNTIAAHSVSPADLVKWYAERTA